MFRLLRTIASVALFLITAGVGLGEGLEDQTATITLSVAGLGRTSATIYFSSSTIFAQFSKSEGGGYVCPYGRPQTVVATCTAEKTADCDGPFLNFRLKRNIETTNTSTCQASKLSAGTYCANVTFEEHHRGERKSYNAKGTMSGCLVVEPNGACSFTGERVASFDGKPQRWKYRSTKCRLVPGRHL